MTRRDLLLLALLGLAAVVLVAALQTAPGYMDADYYYAGGLQIAAGKGFSEPYLWNYLDEPVGLPHPSHANWMPLASILSAIIPSLFGQVSWFIERIPFYLLVACLPPLTAALAYTLTFRRSLALTSGLLAVFSGFYLPFLATTDTFSLYMLFGGLFFLIIRQLFVTGKISFVKTLLLGLLTGLMHLSRADGIIWLVVALVVVLSIPVPSGSRIKHISIRIGLCLAGYLFIMVPWFARNEIAFGSILAPGNSKMLWLTMYDEIFTFPANQLTFQHWWGAGWAKLLEARAWSFGMNLATMLTVQGEIFLFPLILIGMWTLRKDRGVKIALLGWLLTLTVMTIVFPFAGARGGFFHSGASMQLLWWALAPIGLERLIQWGRDHRSWKEAKARPGFLSGLVSLAVLFTISILIIRLPGWGQEASGYGKMAELFRTEGISTEAIVIVSNPPGFYLASSNPAIAIPEGDIQTILDLAQHYGAEYIILEDGSLPARLRPVYEHPQDYPELNPLGEVEGAHLYAIRP